MKIFDNSNLAESYSGVTTPLTFSFARYVYQEVYKNFCQMMGVSKNIIKANSDMFPEMVVYIGGRMYYDLTNWYRLVSFLPGYSFNKGFFEEMLGVNKKADFEKETTKSFIKRWFFYFPKTLWQIIKIMAAFLFMGSLVKKFCTDFDNTYNAYLDKNLSQETEESLKKIFNKLTTKLVVRWKIPIANDFAVMVSTGIVHKLFNKWLPEQNSYTFLYVGSTLPLISLDPGLLIMAIVKIIKDNKDLFALFNSNQNAGDILAILAKQYQQHSVSIKIFEYIKKYGDRIPGELKLESKCLNEHPEILINIIISAIKNNTACLHKNMQRAIIKDGDINLLKRMTLSVFLTWARKSIQLREETRFKRTLIFGLARKVFIELGKKYSNKEIINNPDDIFFLTLEEILENATANSSQLKILIPERKKSFALWEKIELPRRIETDLAISDLEKLYIEQKKSQKITAAPMLGMVVSTGGLKKLLAEAMVMKEFNPSAKFADKIIITSHTDPGWSLVFPLIKGIVVERGGMLSHAAIVARELGIPCIVGAENATNVFNTGENLELNLTSGKITKK